MKNKREQKICYSVVIALLFVSGWFLTQNIQVTAVRDALAETDTSAVSSACTDPTAAGFIPDAAYTFTWSAPAAGAAATPSCTYTITGAVNGETAGSCTATLVSGSVVGTIATPATKLGGLQCQALSQATLQAQGDGTDNTSFDIAIGNIADADTVWTAADKVDEDATPDMLFGGSGQVGAAAITDAGDGDSATNGEVTFDGAEGAGGSEMKVNLDVTNFNPQAVSEVETLTLTLTGS